MGTLSNETEEEVLPSGPVVTPDEQRTLPSAKILNLPVSFRPTSIGEPT
jgi:hypothetical protein